MNILFLAVSNGATKCMFFFDKIDTGNGIFGNVKILDFSVEKY